MYVQPPVSTTPPLSTHRGWTSSTAACCHLLSYALPGITPPWPVLQTWRCCGNLWNWNCHVASATNIINCQSRMNQQIFINFPWRSPHFCWVKWKISASLVPTPEWASGTVTASRLGLYGTRWWLTSSVCWSTHEYYRYVYIPYIYIYIYIYTVYIYILYIYMYIYYNYMSTMSHSYKPNQLVNQVYVADAFGGLIWRSPDLPYPLIPTNENTRPYRIWVPWVAVRYHLLTIWLPIDHGQEIIVHSFCTCVYCEDRDTYKTMYQQCYMCHDILQQIMSTVCTAVLNNGSLPMYVLYTYSLHVDVRSAASSPYRRDLTDKHTCIYIYTIHTLYTYTYT